MKQSLNFFNFHLNLGLTSVKGLFLQVLCCSARGLKLLENLTTYRFALRKKDVAELCLLKSSPCPVGDAQFAPGTAVADSLELGLGSRTAPVSEAKHSPFSAFVLF